MIADGIDEISYEEGVTEGVPFLQSWHRLEGHAQSPCILVMSVTSLKVGTAATF